MGLNYADSLYVIVFLNKLETFLRFVEIQKHIFFSLDYFKNTP